MQESKQKAKTISIRLALSWAEVYILKAQEIGSKSLGSMKEKKENEVTQSCPTLCDPMDCSPPGSSVHGIFQARVLEWTAISLLQGIFLTQGLNPDLLHCRQMLYHLSHQGKEC